MWALLKAKGMKSVANKFVLAVKNCNHVGSWSLYSQPVTLREERSHIPDGSTFS